MKHIKIIFLFIFLFYFQSWTKADDIRDFQIEGMSIGDSLLDHFSESEIQKAKSIRTPYFHKDKFIELEIKTKNSKNYDYIRYTWKKNDVNYILYGIAGITDFPKNFNDCIKTQKKVIKSVESLFPKSKKKDFGKIVSVYDKSKKSYFIETNFEFKDGSMVRIYCENWSKKLEKKNRWTDGLNVIINDIQFLEFLRSAYQ